MFPEGQGDMLPKREGGLEEKLLRLNVLKGILFLDLLKGHQVTVGLVSPSVPLTCSRHNQGIIGNAISASSPNLLSVRVLTRSLGLSLVRHSLRGVGLSTIPLCGVES